MWKVLEHIEAHPKEWTQGCWATLTSCGTSYCFAGWTCVIGGNDDQQPRFTKYGDAYMTARGSEIGSEAAELLGLSDEDACALFDGTNGLDHLRALVEYYTADTGE
jgi:hypothetical protein